MKFKRFLAAALSVVMTASMACFTATAIGAESAEYTFDGEFDYSEEKYVITMNYVGPKANMTAFGIGYNKDVMDNMEVVYSDILQSTGTKTPVNDEEAGIYYDVLYPKTGSAFGDDSEEPVLIAEFTFDMTADQYIEFDPEEDFTELEIQPDITGAYENGNWIFIKNSEEFSLDVAARKFPVEFTTLNDNKDIEIEVVGVDEYVTTVTAPTEGTMLTAITFTTVTAENEAPADVSYSVDGIPMGELTAADDGETYTIPAENVLGDITISFDYGTPIEEVALRGITAPEALATPDTTATAGADTYTIDSVEWEPAVTDKFGFDTAYTVKVTVTSKDGYAFTRNTVYKINGETATSVIRIDADTAELSFTFEPTVKELGKISVSAGLVRAANKAAYKNFGTITVKDSEGTPVATVTEGTEAGSVFRAEFELLAGEYTVEIAKNGYLTATLFATVVYNETDELEIDLIAGNLYNEEAPDNDEIDLDDFANLVLAFTSETDITDTAALAEYRALVDIDEDGFVTIYDLAYIKNNYDAGYGE